MTIIDGKMVAKEIQLELQAQISRIKGRKPCLAVILVGDHPPSKIYVNRKTQACAEIGMTSVRKELPSTVTEAELMREIETLNHDPNVDGILVQLPLPLHVNPFKVTQWITPSKDVDGFHPLNVGKLLIGETDGFFPCTPLGVKTLLDRYRIEVAGRHVVVFGRSNIVGKPMGAILMQSMPGGNATVTIAHRQSTDIAKLCSLADILIIAIGQPKFIKADMVKEGSIVIDVGINKITNAQRPSGYEIVGDADFENLKNKCSFITPVPGGVGPMTIAMLLKNTLQAFFKRCTAP